MLYQGSIWVGTSENQPVCLLPQMANRHGLITGATGTGKTVTLKVLAEGFSDMGVPVFFSDVKGDLHGMVKPGENSDQVASRLMSVGVSDFQFQSYPTVFWDVYGEQGHPVRATVSEMGPLLLGRILNLNETQMGVLNIVFRVADAENMLLLDIKDVKAMLMYVGENADRYTLQYGNVTKQSVGAIQRALAVLEDQGGNLFFGEPSLNITDWMNTDESGRGNINILTCEKLFRNPVMYSTFLLWMLSELYEALPEQGDSDKPRMVFFFDEAHLLFKDCAKQLMDKIEQIARLIRSKGVGVYFVTQSPADVPMAVLGQLGNRVQHALRAFTPLDQKAVKVAADTFRANPAFDTADAITKLQTGEALLSFLDPTGAPSVVSRAIILPPQSFMGAIDAGLRKSFIDYSPFQGVYDEAIDRESAYEYLADILTQGKPKASSAGKQAAAAAPATVSPGVPVPMQQAPAVVPGTAPMAAGYAPAQPGMAPGVATTPVAPASAFMVFDPATGQYVSKTIETMAPLPGQPAAPVAPTVQAAPATQAPQQTIQQNVLVLDPTTGHYVQKQMNMAFDPATGQYVPVMTEAERKAAEKAQRDAEAAAAKAKREEERLEKERVAAERRDKADALRDERANRARANNSVVGRVKNTAINQVTRTITNELTRGLMGTITGKKK